MFYVLTMRYGNVWYFLGLFTTIEKVNLTLERRYGKHRDYFTNAEDLRYEIECESPWKGYEYVKVTQLRLDAPYVLPILPTAINED